MLPTALIIFTLTIGKFSSSTSNDWVEVVNQSSEQVSFSEYQIQDLKENKIQKNIFIPPNGNCVFDFQNRLNNGGDIIFLKKGDSQIDCVKYGEPESGECANTRSSEPSEAMPNANCFQSTPTPAPTVILTPPPKNTPPQPSTHSGTGGQATPKQTILSYRTAQPDPVSAEHNKIPDHVRDDAGVRDDNANEEVIVIGGEEANYLPYASIFGGITLALGSIASIIKKEYNERHPHIQT